MTRHILGVFAKYPTPGEVKSRLALQTSAVWAARVAEAFLLDWLERLERLPLRKVLAFAPPAAVTEMAALAGGCALTPQAAGDLGERLSAFLHQQFADGARQVAVIGTDSPTLPLAFLDQAFAELEKADLVLGPATDGGYYLIGCRAHWPELFQEIPWSSPVVLLETVRRAEQLGLRLALLPPWYDVDTLADWRLLCGHLAAVRLAGLDPGLPRTERLAAAESGWV